MAQQIYSLNAESGMCEQISQAQGCPRVKVPVDIILPIYLLPYPTLRRDNENHFATRLEARTELLQNLQGMINVLQTMMRNNRIEKNIMRQFVDVRVNFGYLHSLTPRFKVQFDAIACTAGQSCQEVTAAASEIQHRVVSSNKLLELPTVEDS
jgi:hypothetical protein